MGAKALREGKYAPAIKLLTKSLQLYPLPGVEVLLSQAQAAQANGAKPGMSSGGSSSSSSNYHSNNNSANDDHSSRSDASSRRQQQQYSRSGSAPASSSSSSRQTPSGPPPRAHDSFSRSSSSNGDDATRSSRNGTDGRPYTDEQVAVVSQILRSKRAGGREIHYRVLGIERTADDAAIKRAYRKLSLKVHPDKNSAPHADEAFKALGLAYATLSDPQKRTIYDRYGEEDPDNRGGGASASPFGGMRRGRRSTQEVDPEEIFNMFFGGGMPGGMGGGGPGFHVYTSGFGGGPGIHFRTGGMGGGMPRASGQRGRQTTDDEPDQDPRSAIALFLQFLPLILIMVTAFFQASDSASNMMGGSKMPGVDRYFSLTVS
jgi:hypothetical protein